MTTRDRTTAIRRRSAAVLLAAAGAAVAAAMPGSLGAQQCGLLPGAGVAVAVGQASYELLDEVSGRMYGVDGAFSLSNVSLQAGYRRAQLGRGDADIGRLAIALPLPTGLLPLGPIAICGSGHAGAARLPVGEDGTTVVAGGLGLRVAASLPLGGVHAVPYGEVRGLAARSSGSLFGWDVGASGLAVGVEGGVRATLGLVTLSVAASLDGFDDGLGITPYPDTAVEVGVGIRF